MNVIYARLGLDRTGEEVGIDRQVRECRDWCEREGWPVDDVIVDNDLSATTGVTRPGFERLLALPLDKVVVWHIDRLVRLNRDLEKVIEQGFPVHALHAGFIDLSTPAGRAVARTITAWAQYEGEQKAERQKSQHRQRRSNGVPWWHSNPPFGYDATGKVIPDEGKAILQGYAMRERGHGWQAVADEWNAAGLTRRKGSEWTSQSVRLLLCSGRNAAVMETGQGSSRMEVGQGSWEPIVDEVRWRALVLRSKHPGWSWRVTGRREGLLTGILRCAECEATHHIRNYRTLKSGEVVASYGCPRGHSSAPVSA